ncbi:unnamed protein product [Haemonchus placei]|uniref:MFS domain-containing protein n=1 Tax=Haemonchus placei TaxID=6290 RepID=A0A0N4X7X7_HAEPC|nr:unnamed protein product [Haemonchus placei]
MALLRAYAATSSSKQDRARAIAFVSGGIAIGTVIGPAFQLLFTPLGSNGVRVLPFLRLSIYNTPALFALLLNIMGFIAIVSIFEENYDVLNSTEKKDNDELPSPCKIAVLVCVFTRFVQIFVSASSGTLGSAFSMLMFSFNKEEAVTAYSSANLAAGCVSITLYFAFIFFDLKKWVPKRISTVLSISLYACLFLFTLPWSFLPNNVEISEHGSDRGCFADRFDWCADLRAVSPFFEEDLKANVELKTKEAARSGTPWTSIYLAGGCAFIQGAQFDMFSSSMWPYLKKLNPEAMETEFGHITALYSFGQCIISPAFGYWSNRIEQVRLPLLTCFIFMMAGNLSYFLLEFFARSNVAHVMMVARFIVGCGSGNMALLSAYAATSSSKQDRARAIAFVNGGVAIGTVVGPGFQLLFTCLGPDGVHLLPFLRLNIYNTPALFATLLNIIGFLAISFMFKENYDVLNSIEHMDTKELPPPSLIAVLVCVSTRFVQVFVSATIGTYVYKK